MYPSGRTLIIIMLILVWWTRVDSGKSTRLVDCKKYVYHPHCRGTQAKKRIVDTFEERKTNRACICKNDPEYSYGGRKRNIISNSKLLAAMLIHGVDMNAIYDAYSEFLSSSTESNGGDGFQENSIVRSSGRRNSNDKGGGRNNRIDEAASVGRIIPLSSKNMLDSTDPIVDLDYSS